MNSAVTKQLPSEETVALILPEVMPVAAETVVARENIRISASKIVPNRFKASPPFERYSRFILTYTL